jgi:adenosylcobinamide-phosphate synthase
MNDLEYALFVIYPAIIVAAFFLDLAIGDPQWLPHPVRVIGKVISKSERILRNLFKTPFEEKIGGIILTAFVTGSTFASAVFIIYVIYSVAEINDFLYVLSTIALIYLCSTTIATKELVNAARCVIDAVKEADIKSARKHLSMIVGRDTDKLPEKNILKATMETLSENLSDGVVAPLFYLSIGGIPAAMAYKAINTLDSMVGYKNDKYKYFGWASARLDDIANYIPARITGVIIVAASAIYFRSFSAAGDSLRIMILDGKKHLSPNAGIPEAAMAGALGVMLGGPSSYGGVVCEKPYIGKEKNDNYLNASEMTIAIIRLSSVIATIVAATVLYLRVAS